MRRLLLLSFFGIIGSAGAQITESTVSSTVVTTLAAEGTNSYSNELVLELKAKSLLLQTLADEHLRKAEQDQILNQPEKSRWERELAAELQTKNAALARQLADLRAQRNRAEPPANSTPLGRALPIGGAKLEGLDPDEMAYLAKLGEKLVECEQGITAALEASQSFVMQFQTNNTPDQMQRVSSLLEDNRRLLRELTFAQSDLELRKLEFWAYRRRKM